MSENWLQEYILLAFRIDKVTQTTYESPFVEAYYGPAEWRIQAESEPKASVADLVRQTMALQDTLSVQGFSTQRTAYLGKHVRAMETLCRKLNGETFSLEQEARDCLDIQPVWTPEKQFEQAHALYEKVLPGTGNLAERLEAYRRDLAFPQTQSDALIGFIERAFAEARKRTCALIELPEGETIDFQLSQTGYDASARYQGNYCTRVEMNLDATAAYIARLFDHKVCHEGYPGHHTEYVLKEQLLAQKLGHTEQTIVLTLCPQCVITEGIAMVAHEMTFAEGEAERWIAEHVYSFLQKDVDPMVLLQLRQASELLGAVWDNAALLLDEGRPEQEVERYITRYMLFSQEKAPQMVAHLKQPIWGRYELTYASGKRLMCPWLQGADKVTNFQHFLTEQLLPSQLEGKGQAF